MASKTLDRLVKNPNCPIEDYDDLRQGTLGSGSGGYIVYLYQTHQWEPDDDTTVRGFDTISEIRQALTTVCRKKDAP